MGEDNAVPARVIWQAHGLWTIATVKNRLNEMVKAGQIERRYLARSGKPNRHGRLFQKAASIFHLAEVQELQASISPPL